MQSVGGGKSIFP